MIGRLPNPNHAPWEPLHLQQSLETLQAIAPLLVFAAMYVVGVAALTAYRKWRAK